MRCERVQRDTKVKKAWEWEKNRKKMWRDLGGKQEGVSGRREQMVVEGGRYLKSDKDVCSDERRQASEIRFLMDWFSMWVPWGSPHAHVSHFWIISKILSYDLGWAWSICVYNNGCSTKLETSSIVDLWHFIWVSESKLCTVWCKSNSDNGFSLFVTL